MILPSKNLVATLVVELGEYTRSDDGEPIRTDKFQCRYNTGGFRVVHVYSYADGKVARHWICRRSWGGTPTVPARVVLLIPRLLNVNAEKP